MTVIISVSGLIGSGKDTAAAYLIEKYGFTKVSFSKSLKDVVAAIFNWDRELLEGDTVESREWRERVDEWWSDELGMEITPRLALQLIGTDVMRAHFHDDIWMLSLKNRLVKGGFERVVSTDTRFINELHLMKSMGAHTLGVFRKLPSWLPQFYKLANQAEALSLDMRFASERQTLASVADAAGKQVAPKVHRSEFQHLLWRDYDKVIDNTKSLQCLYDQIDALCAAKGISAKG